jgi:hypothetical protein
VVVAALVVAAPQSAAPEPTMITNVPANNALPSARRAAVAQSHKRRAPKIRNALIVVAGVDRISKRRL